MSTKMINFRVKEADVPALDTAADQCGLNRSDFVRAAVNEKIARTRAGAVASPTPVVISNEGTRGPSVDKTEKQTPFANCPKNPACNVQKLVTGVKVCTTCEVRF